jgi:hypothetical protein
VDNEQQSRGDRDDAAAGQRQRDEKHEPGYQTCPQITREVKSVSIEPTNSVVHHVRKQMERRVVREVRSGQNVSQVSSGNPADPGVVDHVLRIIDLEEPKAEVSSVEPHSREHYQHE